MEEKIGQIFSLQNLEVKSFSRIETHINKIYRVKTNKGNYFLKIYENKEEQRTGKKLNSIYSNLSKHNLPVPSVLTYDDTLSLLKYPYIILTEVEGTILKNAIKHMDNKTKEGFYKDLGKVVGKIHQFTFKEFGDTFDFKTIEKSTESNNKGPFKTWKEMFPEIINYRLSLFKNSNFEDLTNNIREYFNKNLNLIDYNIEPRLLHIDLNQKNIFVKDSKVSGIIDFDESFIGHNEEELMRLEGANFKGKENLRKAFLQGYKKHITLDEGYENRRTFYYLSRLLVHVGCLIQVGENYVEDLEKETEVVREEIKKITKGEKVYFDKNR